MFTRLWFLSTAERAVKTFVQGYLATFFLLAGLGSGPVDDYPGADTFDLLFTWNNIKGGVVAAFISFLMSIGSTRLGPDKDSPSLVVTETEPAVTEGA